MHGYVFLLEYSGGRYINQGKLMAGGKAIDVYGAPSPNMEDFDGDGDLELVCGEFIDRLTLFENMGTTGEQVLLEHRGNLGTIKLAGHTTSPAIVDWDRNFIPDQQWTQNYH